MTKPVTLSVLDIVPLRSSATASEAFAETLEIAKHVEELGYHRYWFAEHHGMGGVASTSPALLAGRVAALTKKIRVGSGGVMLPNHSPLVIAEQFGTLEALFPGRIDLGLGRAPGTDRFTAMVLRRTQPGAPEDDFAHQLSELQHFFRGTFPESHPYHKIRAVPALGNEPPVWLLGSSGYSAQLAARLGMPFSFAHHFSAANTIPALSLYRGTFQPSKVLSKPQVMLGVIAIVAETDKEARRLALPTALSFLRLQRNQTGPYPTVEQAEAHPWTFAEKSFVEEWLSSHIIGSPATAKRRLNNLIDDTNPDELTVLCTAPDKDSRQRSYQLLRELTPQ